jgi:hypothetical protein
MTPAASKRIGTIIQFIEGQKKEHAAVVKLQGKKLLVM